MRPGLALVAGGLLLAFGAFVGALLDPGSGRLAVEPNPWPSLLAGLGGLALLAGAFLERRALRRALATRQARHGSLATAYTLIVLIGLAALAFLVERQGWRADLTRDRVSSLEADTLRVLASVPEDGGSVELFGFVAGGGLQQPDVTAAVARLEPLFALLERASPRVTTRFLDASREPVLSRELGIARLPSVAVRWSPAEGPARVVRTDVLEEREVARAIEQALLGVLVPVHVIQGHGEMSAADMQGSGGLFAALMAVAADNYDVRPLNLTEAGALPEEPGLLVIAGPRTDYLPAEVELLSGFVAQGGRLLLLLGPDFDSEGRVRPLPVLEAWLRRQLGVQLGASVVCDLEGLSGPGADLRTLALPADGQSTHPIVRGRDRILVFPFARPVVASPAPPHGAYHQALARSGSRSWAEADTPASPAFDPGDERGPHAVAQAVTYQPHGQERPGRLVIVGSHLFASNAYIPLAGNSSFLLDSVAWLNEREQVLEARRARGRDGTAVVPHRQGVLILLCAGALPLVIAAFGLVTWWHRRRL